MALTAWFLYRGTLWERRWLLKALIFSIPLPVVACQLGWMAAEVGRQPWIVYHLMRTSQAHSPTVGAAEIAFSLGLFSLIYLLLLCLWLFMMVRKAKQGPEIVSLEAVDAKPVADQVA